MLYNLASRLRYYKKWGKIYYWFAISKIFNKKYWRISIDGVELKLCTDHPYQNMVARTMDRDQGENNLLFGWKKLSEHSKVILDIGGYNGMYGILSGLVNPQADVYIFEPDTINRACIKNNISLNNVTNVTIVNSVIFDSVGKVHFREHPGGSGGNVSSEENFEVDSTTLDEWAKQNNKIPDLIKMDIEGAEYRALQGGIRTLTVAPKLTLLLEIHQKFLAPRFGDSENAIYNLLEKLNYQCFYLDKNTATTHCLIIK